MLITEMYGGKIDDEDDFELLGRLVYKVFDSAAFEDDHQLGLSVPSGRTVEDFSTWVVKLP